MKYYVVVLIALLAGHSVAVEKGARYTAGEIVDIQQKINTRVLYYLVNTPITQDDPYFEISVQLGDTVFAGRYTPLHAHDMLPDEWQTGATVQARVEGHHLLVRRPSGVDVDFGIEKRSAVKPSQRSPEPAPRTK